MENDLKKMLSEMKLYQMAQAKLLKDILLEIKSMNRKVGELI
jgi:hypothetical protein